jgi:hypothetical protein
LLYAAIAGPLTASVITDAILTGLRLSETEFRVIALVPLLSMAAEMAFTAVLVTPDPQCHEAHRTRFIAIL